MRKWKRQQRQFRRRPAFPLPLRRQRTGIRITAQGAGAHASTPQEGKNALTGLVAYIIRLPLAPCPQLEAMKSLAELFPHGDTCGKALGIDMEDEISGALTLAFDLLEVKADSLEGVFDCRSPLCAMRTMP